MSVAHGARQLPEVVVESYNLELKEDDEFVGDRASWRAFADPLEKWREGFRDSGDDPLGNEDSAHISKRKLDKTLFKDDSEAAEIVHGAIEDFAQELADFIRRFMRMKAWHGRNGSSLAVASAADGRARSPSAAPMRF